jgi:hypothetical protein
MQLSEGERKEELPKMSMFVTDFRNETTACAVTFD